MCDLSAEWIKKESSETENTQWLLANSRPCIKCAVPVEKNGGCNYMRCSRCNQEFCWVCMMDWPKYHADHWKCNKIEEVKADKGF